MTFLKRFLVSILINFCVSVSLPCKDCALSKTTLPVKQLKLLRQEYLMDQILRKLHLTEAPKINLPKPPLNSLLVIAEMTKNDTSLEFETQPKEIESIVIYPKNGSLLCSEHEAYFCNRFEFSIPAHVILENFLSAEVWIHRNNTNVLRAYQIVEDSLKNATNSYELNNTSTGNTSWCKYSVLGENIWSNNASDNVLVIELIGDKTDTTTPYMTRNGIETPFLVIRIEVADEKWNVRRKRSTICIDNNPSCCKENFYLNFEEIGWDNWILHPDGYQANFCRGRCFNDFNNTRFYHSSVLLSYINDNKDIAEGIGLSMCCTPSIMAPLTIFYRNEEGLIYQKKIDNMRVEACDCA